MLRLFRAGRHGLNYMRRKVFLLAAIFLIYLCVCSLGRSRLVGLSAAGPAQSRYLAGDEPAYMLLAHSLVADGDFNLYNNRAESDGRFFGKESCDEHGARRDWGNKQIYSIHTPGLAILIAPAYALGLYGPISPRAAVCVFMNVLAALLAVNLYLFCTEISGSSGQSSWPALLATASVALTPPVLFYSNLVYPELPAALLILYAVRHCVPMCGGMGVSENGSKKPMNSSELTPIKCAATAPIYYHAGTPTPPHLHTPTQMLSYLAIAALPWLSFRFAIPSLVLLWMLLCKREGREDVPFSTRLLIVLPFCATVALLVCYQYRAFGTINPAAGYLYQGFSQRNLLRGLDGAVGLIVDRGHGILTWSPVYILSLTGILLLLREQRRIGARIIILLLAIYLPGALYMHWWGGFAPPPRYMVVPAPLLGGALCYALSRNPKRPFLLLFGILLAASLTFGYLGLMHPSLLYRHRHIINNFPRLSWLIAFLPSFFRKGPSTWPLAALWGMIILLTNVIFAVRWREPGDYHSSHGAGPRA